MFNEIFVILFIIFIVLVFVYIYKNSLSVSILGGGNSHERIKQYLIFDTLNLTYFYKISNNSNKNNDIISNNSNKISDTDIEDTIEKIVNIYANKHPELYDKELIFVIKGDKNGYKKFIYLTKKYPIKIYYIPTKYNSDHNKRSQDDLFCIYLCDLYRSKGYGTFIVSNDKYRDAKDMNMHKSFNVILMEGGKFTDFNFVNKKIDPNEVWRMITKPQV